MSLVKRPTKPDIVFSIAIYKCEGAVSHANIDDLIKRLDDHLHILRGMHIKGVLVSFKSVTKLDKEPLVKLIKSLSLFHAKLRCSVGLCDYSAKLFPILMQLITGTPLGLFKTADVLALAIGTSNVHRHSSILVHSDDVDNRQSIASTLISNNYFVVMAFSEKDFQDKSQQKDRFDRLVYQSLFSNMQEEVTIGFERNIFIYEFKGSLNESLGKIVKVQDFEYRLSLGYKVFIFDLTRIFQMNLRAAYFFLELEQLAAPFKAQICLIDLRKEKIDSNALAVLNKSKLWIYDHINDAFEDDEVIEMTAHKHPHYSTGISKELLSMTPYFIAASIQSLEIYEIKNPDKSPSKQINVKKLYALKPTIVTHITFAGDYEGELIFLFAQKSAEILIKNILGDFDGYEGNDYLDAMTEFVNAVTGKLKSNLRKKHKCVQFSIPYSTATLEDIIPMNSPQSIVLTTFMCDGNEYYVGLTSPRES